MAEKSSAIELQEKLTLLQENFFLELKKIAEQRLKLEESTPSLKRDLSTKGDISYHVGETKLPVSKPFTVRLESSLGEKLAKSRGTADELEDKLHETRIAFEDKQKTVERIKKELDRRENLLIYSIRQIETCLRAIFYLKQEADDMYVHLKNTSEGQEVTLEELKNDCITAKAKKESIKKAISTFLPVKISAENMLTDLPRYSHTKDLVEYYLVLKELQRDLLREEAECSEAEKKLAVEKQQLEEYKQRIPLMLVLKESALLELKSKLRNKRDEIAQLKEEMNDAIFTKVKEDTAWYDIYKWIKKRFSQCADMRPPGPDEPTTGTLNMLDRIKDFVADGLEMVDRLKKGTAI